MRPWVGIAPVLLVMLVGSASAESERFDAKVGHERLETSLLEVLDGLDAEGLRNEIDQAGDGDDFVSNEEVEAYQEQRSRDLQGDEYPQCFDHFDFVQINGEGPAGLLSIRETVVQADGRVDSDREVYRSTAFVFKYANQEPNPSVSVEFARLYDVYQSVLCAAGWNSWWSSWWTASAFFDTEFMNADMAGAASQGNAQQQEPGDAEETTYVFGSIAGITILQDTLEPAAASGLWDGTGLTADSDVERQYLFNNVIRFTITGGPIAEDDGAGAWVKTAAIVGAVGAGSAGVAALGMAATEVGRYKFLKFLIGIPLFSRFEKDQVLEHGTREQLYHFIKENPGPSFSDLRRELDVSNGTLVHHLRILEHQEFVKPVRDGFRTRFYVRGPRVIPQTYLTRTQQTVLEAIQSNPGLTQKQLSQVLGLPRESVFYHARKLETAGKLRIQKDGKWRKYFPEADQASSAGL